MFDNGEVDHSALRSLIDWHVENGTDGIVAVGTTGESATLPTLEHCEVIQAIVEHVNGRVPVIAGTGANSTSEAIELTACAKARGADAALLVSPYYNKPTQHGLVAHHRAIAKAVDLPQILYNVPGRTCSELSIDTIVELASVGNIVGVKEASDLARVAQLRAACPDDFRIWSGNDDEARQAIYDGASGVISVTANVAPQLLHDMCAAALAGDRAKADAIDEKLNDLHASMFVESNPIPVKWAMHRMGRSGAGIRLPLTWLSNSFHSQVEKAMEKAGVL